MQECILGQNDVVLLLQCGTDICRQLLFAISDPKFFCKNSCSLGFSVQKWSYLGFILLHSTQGPHRLLRWWLDVTFGHCFWELAIFCIIMYCYFIYIKRYYESTCIDTNFFVTVLQTRLWLPQRLIFQINLTNSTSKCKNGNVPLHSIDHHYQKSWTKVTFEWAVFQETSTGQWLTFQPFWVAMLYHWLQNTTFTVISDIPLLYISSQFVQNLVHYFQVWRPQFVCKKSKKAVSKSLFMLCII